MLVRLLYVSRTGDSFGADALAAILKTSRENNGRDGITGVLCHCSNAGIFLQVLEGGRSAVSTLYSRIGRDERHHDVELLSYEEIGERSFSSWSMGQVNMGRLNPSVVLKYSQSASLDPYAVSGKASLALFNDLVATASVGSQA